MSREIADMDHHVLRVGRGGTRVISVTHGQAENVRFALWLQQTTSSTIFRHGAQRTNVQ